MTQKVGTRYVVGFESGGFKIVALNVKTQNVVWYRKGAKGETWIVDRLANGKLSRVKLVHDQAEAFRTAGIEVPAAPAA